jgi:undecaprenyl-diphosphatase
MTALHHTLFFWINLTPESPAWLMGLARLSSTALPVGLLALVLLALVLGPAPWRRMALHMGLAIALAWLIARGLSSLFPSPRPFVLGLGYQGLAHKPTPSFPSSHASVACAFAAAAWYSAPHALGRWAAVLLALLVTWSRVALGVHFPLDALAGAVFGVLSAVLTLPLSRWVTRRLVQLRERLAPAAR